jgi:hypothetical protein
MFGPEKAEAAPHSYSLVTPHVDAPANSQRSQGSDNKTDVTVLQSAALDNTKPVGATKANSTQVSAPQPSNPASDNTGGGSSTDSNTTPAAPTDPVVETTDSYSMSATIPAVSFGATDGLPDVIVRGQSYTVTFPMVGADPSQAQTASLIGRGFVFDPSCTDYPLALLQETDITCVVTVKANALNPFVRAVSSGIGSKLIRHTIDNTIKAASVATATPSTSTVNYGTPRTLSVAVTAAGYTPTGTVSVKVDGVTNLAPARLVGGVATVTIPATLALGTHTLAATYNGDAWVTSSTAAPQSITVVKANPVITSSLALGAAGASVDATVTATGISAVTGSVTLYEGATRLASGTLASGTASLALPPTLSSGTHTLTVNYSGSSLVAAEASTVVVTLP